MAHGEIRKFGGEKQQPVQIMGAQEIPDAQTPEIRTVRSAPLDPIRVEVHQHEEVIIEDGKLRRPKRDENAPDVRVRLNGGTFQKALENDD